MGSFADYCALQFYIGNEDGPFQNNNWQMWRVRVPGEDDSPYADGKWRMMVYDTDFSSGIYDSGNNGSVDSITPVLTNTEYQGRHPARLMISLIQNDEFLGEMINAMCDIRNLHFNAKRTASLLKEMTDWYLPYVPDTLRRFGPQWVTWNPENHFRSNLNGIGKFFETRASRFPDIVKKAFDLGGTISVTCKIDGPGTVIVNGRTAIPLEKTTQMKYFREYPITITAVPAEGATFVGWKLSSKYGALGDASAETTTLSFTRTVTFTAVFE